MAKYEIDIDDRLILDGCELVRIDEMERSPQEGETSVSVRLVYRPTYTHKDWWPKWLMCDWVVLSRSGSWYASAFKPDLYPNGWNLTSNMSELSSIADTSNFPEVPWEESLFKNPWKSNP